MKKRSGIFAVSILFTIMLLGAFFFVATDSVSALPGPIDHYEVVSITPQIAGVGWSGTATAYDVDNNVVTSDSTTVVTMTSTGAAAFYTSGTYDALGNTYTLSSGIATFYMMDNTAETIVLTATSDGPKTGSIADIVVNPASLDHFTVTGVPADCIAGTSWAGGSGMVTAFDVYNNIKTDYTGDVYFTSNDSAATLPYTSESKYTFTSGTGLDNGMHTFDGAGFTLFTAGSRTITITTGVISLTSTAITVNPAVLDHFTVTGITDPVVAGVLSSPVVTAYDAYDNIMTDYTGTVHFNSTDVKGSTVLPGDYTFLLGDAGVKTFTDGVKLTTVGEQSVTVTSTVGSKTGSQTAITVDLAPFDHILIVSTTSQVAGVGWSGTATAHDVFHNIITTDSTTVVTMNTNGSAAYYTSDTYDTLGNTYTLSSGIAAFYMKDNIPQTIRIVALAAGVTPTVIMNITVGPAPFDHFDVTVGGTLSFVAGAPWATTANDVVVTALDSLNNVVTSYTGSPVWSASCAGTLPVPQAFVAGTSTFIGTGFALNIIGAQTITMNDGSINGSSANITIGPAEFDHYALTGIADPLVAGVPASPVVTAYDIYDNIKTDYTGTIHFNSTDVKGSTVLPGDYTFLLEDAGVKTFTNGLMLTTTGDLTVNVTSTTGPVTISQIAITVTPGAIDQYQVVSTTSQVAGAGWSGTATAYDAFQNMVANDNTTVVTMTTNGSAVYYTSGTFETLGNNYTLSSGIATFFVKDNTAETIVLTATSAGTKTGNITDIVVVPAAFDHFTVTGITDPVLVGALTSPTVIACDAYGNVRADYNGTIHFTSDDVGEGTILPADYAFVLGDAGVHVFTDGVKLTTVGEKYVKVQDTITATAVGQQSDITVYTVPDAPTGLTAVAGNAQITLNWTAPTNNGGSVITGYKVYRATSETGTYTMIVSVSGLSYIDTGRTSGETYWYNVSAVNAAGEGAKTALVSSTPYNVPNAPTGPMAIATDAQVILNWTAPTNNGGSVITGYKVYRATSETGTYLLIASPSEPNYTDSGLVNGQTYWYNVSAVNAAGEGAKTALVSSTPYTVPNAPTGLTASAIYAKVTLTWTAPNSTGGSPIVLYKVYRGLSEANVAYVGNSTSAAFVDTTAAGGSTYYYKVSATNAAGESAQSASASIVVPNTLPVTGKIVDSNGNGLSGVTVALEDGKSVMTDANGSFTIFATPGNHTLKISGPGIEEKKMDVTVAGSPLALGNVNTNKTTDYLPYIVIVAVVGALLAGLLVVLKKRKK